MGQHSELNYQSIDELNQNQVLKCESSETLSAERVSIALTGEPPPPINSLKKAEAICYLKCHIDCLYRILDVLEIRDLNSVGCTCKWLNRVIKEYMKRRRTPSASILHLNDECLHRLFDWLSLVDLHSLGRTCTTLQKSSGKYFQRRYASSFVIGDLNGIHAADVDVNGFAEFIEKISIFKIDLNELPYDPNSFVSLRQMNLVRINLANAGVDSWKEILSKIEALELIDCNFTGDFDKFLKSLPKLKRLSVRNRERNVIIGTGNQWLFRPRPTLEYVKLVHKEGVKINELKTFFVRNRSVRNFATNGNGLWDNRTVLTEAKAKFDQLTIDVDCWAKRNMNIFCKLLNELHDKGVFKRLFLNTKYVDQSSIKAIASLNALERLYVMNYDNRNVLLHSLINVKELAISVSFHVADLHKLAQTLNKLERIYFNQATSDDIFVFIANSAQLKEITVQCLPYGIHFYRGVLDLPALNEERKKLNTTQKVNEKKSTYYVSLLGEIKNLQSISFSL